MEVEGPPPYNCMDGQGDDVTHTEGLWKKSVPSLKSLLRAGRSFQQVRNGYITSDKESGPGFIVLPEEGPSHERGLCGFYLPPASNWGEFTGPHQISRCVQEEREG